MCIAAIIARRAAAAIRAWWWRREWRGTARRKIAEARRLDSEQVVKALGAGTPAADGTIEGDTVGRDGPPAWLEGAGRPQGAGAGARRTAEETLGLADSSRKVASEFDNLVALRAMREDKSQDDWSGSGSSRSNPRRGSGENDPASAPRPGSRDRVPTLVANPRRTSGESDNKGRS
jgi:hypothetical protein